MDRMDFNQVLEDLVEATEVENANTVSQFPQDLETASNILEMAVEYLVDDLSSNPDSPNPLSVVSFLCGHWCVERVVNLCGHWCVVCVESCGSSGQHIGTKQ